VNSPLAYPPLRGVAHMTIRDRGRWWQLRRGQPIWPHHATLPCRSAMASASSSHDSCLQQEHGAGGPSRLFFYAIPSVQPSFANWVRRDRIGPQAVARRIATNAALLESPPALSDGPLRFCRVGLLAVRLSRQSGGRGRSCDCPTIARRAVAASNLIAAGTRAGPPHGAWCRGRTSRDEAAARGGKASICVDKLRAIPGRG